jgi:hypothetical protein
MTDDQNNQQGVNLEEVKAKISAVNDLPISSHSIEFEKIHKQLQQALTNLDGV